MIVVVQTDCANLQSVCNALLRLNASFTISDEADSIEEASHLILPGVGHATTAMASLQRKGLIPVLQRRQKPLLGICLGMQLLYEHSEEGDTACLGLLPGIVRAIARSPGLPLPHMGWNRLKRQAESCPLLQGVNEDDSVYFVHSYRAPSNETVLASTQYGDRIAAVVGKGSIWGTQFHPEKSGQVGQRILGNFLGL